jgi:hypothetical protein
MSEETKAPLAEVRFTCGRCYLSVAGIVVAMEGDQCRDGDMPNEVYDAIPDRELETASIGGEPIKDMPIEVVRFFRGSNWTEKMLEYAASKINATSQGAT